jgi:hypothetical protein
VNRPAATGLLPGGKWGTGLGFQLALVSPGGQTDMMEFLQRTEVMIGMALLLVVLIGVFFYLRKQQSEDE